MRSNATVCRRGKVCLAAPIGAAMSTCAAILVLLSALPAAPLAPGTHQQTVRVDGARRKFRIHLPPCYDGCRPLPVVLVYHGMSANAWMAQRFIKMDETADRCGFITVYPDGSGFSLLKGFKAGGSTLRWADRKPDDVEFAHAILDHLEENLCVDSSRVYATGLSNGAMMCYRLAVEMPHRIAAIAPVSGTLGTEVCPPSCPISVLHFHGTCDPMLPMTGPNSKTLSFLTFHSTAHTLQMFASAAGCQGAPVVEDLPDQYDDGTRLRRHTYTDCVDGIEVVLIEIIGGGHQWPQHGLIFRYLGTTSEEVDANETMWCFFQRHQVRPCCPALFNSPPTVTAPAATGSVLSDSR
jgi:polyhydroxybutyrate depolymerase